MFTLIENGEIYAPVPMGRQSVLIAKDEIAHIGDIDRSAIERFGLTVIDAGGCYVTPGFIDPHQHLLGGSGEEGFASQTPEISGGEIIKAGITTVVGCLGVDTVTKTLPGLLAKVKALKEEGFNALMWTGGYTIPPASITGKAANDLLFIDEVIGVGEIAVADERSSDPEPDQLARIVHETHVNGTLSKTAGLTHIHVGGRKERLALIREIVDDRGVEPEWLYMTHINRCDELLKEAIELADRGAWIDIDTVDEDLAKWFAAFKEKGGRDERLTFSSDASIASPQNLFTQFRACLDEKIAPLEKLLPHVTSNTATALKLTAKGRIGVGKIADLNIIEQRGFKLRDVLSRGRIMVKDGELTFQEKFLADSNRRVILEGRRALERAESASGS